MQATASGRDILTERPRITVNYALLELAGLLMLVCGIHKHTGGMCCTMCCNLMAGLPLTRLLALRGHITSSTDRHDHARTLK